MIKKNHACNRMNFSSNINEVIRAVSNSFCTHQKHQNYQKHQKAQRRGQAKAQKATSEQKLKMCLKTSNGKKVTYSLICVFVLVKKIEKSPQNKCTKNTDVPTTWFM